MHGASHPSSNLLHDVLSRDYLLPTEAGIHSILLGIPGITATMSWSDDPSMPSSTSVLVLHSSCHENDATAPEMAFERAWRQLVASAKLSCDMILIPDMAVVAQYHHQQQQQNELDTYGSVVKFRNELLDPCGTYNVFSLSNLVADSYILSLTDCRLRPIIASMPLSSDILLPALAVPSTFHFTWNVSEAFEADAHANAYAEIRVDLDVTKAKRKFRKVWQNKESAKMSTGPTTATTTPTTATNATVAEEQKEENEEETEAGDQHEQQHSNSTETKQVPPTLVDNESYSHVPVVNLPCCPAWEMPSLPPPRTGSTVHDRPHFAHLETLMESELNDINRILSFLTVTGLILFVSFLWTAFQMSHTKSHSHSRASHTPQKTPTTRSSKYKQQRDSMPRTVPMESISMQAVSGGADCNLSPLSLDAILAAQGNCQGPSPPSPSALRQDKTTQTESSTSTITYGPKQRASRRSSVVPNKANNQDNTNEAEPSLSPCSKLAQEWSRNKSARRSLRKDASRTVEASSAVAVATAATAATAETKLPLTPVLQVKPVRGGIGIGIAAAAATSVADIYDKSNDSFAPLGRVAAYPAGHTVPASPARVTKALPNLTTVTTTENTGCNFIASIRIPEELEHPQQQLPLATVTPGPTPRLRPAPSTVNQNHDSSFVHEYWGARAM
jgi:hypothetical protein